jgi:hypothetical protein
MSIAGRNTDPPSDCARASEVSQSSTAKYTAQKLGTSSGTPGGMVMAPQFILGSASGRGTEAIWYPEPSGPSDQVQPNTWE